MTNLESVQWYRDEIKRKEDEIECLKASIVMNKIEIKNHISNAKAAGETK